MWEEHGKGTVVWMTWSVTSDEWNQEPSSKTQGEKKSSQATGRIANWHMLFGRQVGWIYTKHKLYVPIEPTVPF